jgi:hypothetical protein
MSYFRELSPYTFFKAQSSENLRNVGWLDSLHFYRKGKFDSVQLDKLLRLCHSPVNRTRGMHHCPFCRIYPVTMSIDNAAVPLGGAKIRVPGQGQIIFAAPNLICHYIAAHEYLPPDEFLLAVAAL